MSYEKYGLNVVQYLTMRSCATVKILTFLFFIIVLVSCSGDKGVKRDTFDPRAYLQKATELIDNDEFEEARRLLIEVKNRDYSQKYAPIAQLKLAESYMEEEQPDLAIAEYKRFLRLYPEHAQAPYAQYQIAMIYFGQIEGPDKGAGGARRAMEEFEKLLRDYPRNPYREAAELRIKKCKNLIADYEFLVGEFYYKKGSYNAALGRFLSLLKEFPEYQRIPEVLYLTALSFKESNRPDDARNYLEALLERFPESEYAEKAQEALNSLKK